jgi:hypothetical protein
MQAVWLRAPRRIDITEILYTVSLVHQGCTTLTETPYRLPRLHREIHIGDPQLAYGEENPPRLPYHPCEVFTILTLFRRRHLLQRTVSTRYLLQPLLLEWEGLHTHR